MPKGKGRRARPQKKSAIITRKNIGKKNKLSGAASFSIVKKGPITKAFLESVLNSAKKFNEDNGKTILDFQVNIDGEDESGKKKTAVPIKKRSLYFKQAAGTTFKYIEKYLAKPQASFQSFTPKKMEVILILDKQKAKKEFEDRRERSRKQAVGRVRAQAKREQLERDILEMKAAEKRNREKRLHKRKSKK